MVKYFVVSVKSQFSTNLCAILLKYSSTYICQIFEIFVNIYLSSIWNIRQHIFVKYLKYLPTYICQIFEIFVNIYSSNILNICQHIFVKYLKYSSNDTIICSVTFTQCVVITILMNAIVTKVKRIIANLSQFVKKYHCLNLLVWSVSSYRLIYGICVNCSLVRGWLCKQKSLVLKDQPSVELLL